ncbi:uncharacterized protein LOC103508190 [Diaphorina citri]|uniref:Uncharacterized protein LOC103508190 n=1 Tax=Diaphorina citri TaxID=121845 RepID=A0A3Q0IQT6_DIACI|nr:uncharacterized protein LOC103508190 [Diaphorina citri]
MSVVQRLSSRVSGLLSSNLGAVSSPLNESTKNYFTYSLEPSQPLPREPKWCTPEEAVQCIKSGDTVFLSGAASTPIKLAEAMTEHGKANKLKDITVCHMHTEGKTISAKKIFQKVGQSMSFFMAANVRKAVAEGRGDAIPIFLSEIPLLFKRGIIKPNVAIVQVSAPDEHGFCSLGTSVDCVRTAISHSKYIIAQVNKYMPRTFGDALVHQSHFDFACQVTITYLLLTTSYHLLLTLRFRRSHDEHLNLDVNYSLNQSPKDFIRGAAEGLDGKGKPIIALQSSNAKTGESKIVPYLKQGIGSIPDAVLSQLHNHQDLCIGSIPDAVLSQLHNHQDLDFFPLSLTFLISDLLLLSHSGIGSIPDAVLSQLHNHQDLGLHTEMFADGVVPLVEKGCITNNQKPLNRGKIVASFLIGKFYIDCLVDLTGQISALILVVQVDLTGQISADSIGGPDWSNIRGLYRYVNSCIEVDLEMCKK